jgi:hypothetical protein
LFRSIRRPGRADDDLRAGLELLDLPSYALPP